MKVKDLIKILQEYSPEKNVVVEVGEYYDDLNSVKLFYPNDHKYSFIGQDCEDGHIILQCVFSGENHENI